MTDPNFRRPRNWRPFFRCLPGVLDGLPVVGQEVDQPFALEVGDGGVDLSGIVSDRPPELLS